VPDRRSIFRLLALAGFLLTVALALWLAELRPLLVIIVMAVALLVAWAIEWLSWRQDVARLAAEGAELDEACDRPDVHDLVLDLEGVAEAAQLWNALVERRLAALEPGRKVAAGA